MGKLTLIAASLAVALSASLVPSSVWAQSGAQCRAKCTEEEQACLKRTGNKSQCGNTATQCLGKCK